MLIALLRLVFGNYNHVFPGHSILEGSFMLFIPRAIRMVLLSQGPYPAYFSIGAILLCLPGLSIPMRGAYPLLFYETVSLGLGSAREKEEP